MIKDAAQPPLRDDLAQPHQRLVSGGLAVVDVRDLVDWILDALEGKGRDGERYLAVGANPPMPRSSGSSAGLAAGEPAPFGFPPP